MKKRKGFTLLEMSIVLFIISLLILIFLPNLTRQKTRANKVHRSAMTNVVQTQADLYENDSGDRPSSIKQLYSHQYLTKGQYEKALNYHLTISNGQVK